MYFGGVDNFQLDGRGQECQESRQEALFKDFNEKLVGQLLKLHLSFPRH